MNKTFKLLHREGEDVYIYRLSFMEFDFIKFFRGDVGCYNFKNGVIKIHSPYLRSIMGCDTIVGEKIEVKDGFEPVSIQYLGL